MQRVALFTDSNVMLQEFYHTVKDSLVAAGADVVVYDATLVEPTDSSLRDAIDFAVDVNPDGFVSLGGGSTMDTCKAARKSIYCFCFFSTVAPRNLLENTESYTLSLFSRGGSLLTSRYADVRSPDDVVALGRPPSTPLFRRPPVTFWSM